MDLGPGPASLPGSIASSNVRISVAAPILPPPLSIVAFPYDEY